jgi:SNF2 family DNA or RNA helicase
MVDTKINLHLRPGKTFVPTSITILKDKLQIRFPYAPDLIDEIKAMSGARYKGFENPNDKHWEVDNNPRNLFNLRYLAYEHDNPYAPYKTELEIPEVHRPLYHHQKEMVAHILQRKHCIIAAEMGTGKTLSVIEALDHINPEGEIWYVCPKSVVYAIKNEFYKWGSNYEPRYFTYERLKRELLDWEDGDKAPQVLIFDESSRVKNWKAQRTQAAYELARGVLEDWDVNGFVVLMSGSPAPKSPVDWWSQCEIACPGFLKEGDPVKFNKRLALVKMEESLAGGTYPKLVTWYDDPKKCKKCGRPKDDITHELGDCVFEPSTDEISALYKRMSGLVYVKFKKDCFDLPEKIYRQIQIDPSPKILQYYNMIMKTAGTAAMKLTLARELSDGFQYVEREEGTQQCPSCFGTGESELPFDSDGNIVNLDGTDDHNAIVEHRIVKCPQCKGSGQIPKKIRDTKYIESSKEKVLCDLLDEYNEVERVVIYAGFTGSLEKCVEVCIKNGWEVIRLDGRGYKYFGSTTINDPSEMLKRFDDKNNGLKIAFVGQPGAGGMGLTLTASPVIIYYSNTFKAEERIQSEERIHRLGMDENKGATIIDLIHLPTDTLILENLKKKRDLQNITMGELKRVFVDSSMGGLLNERD